MEPRRRLLGRLTDGVVAHEEKCALHREAYAVRG